MISVECHHTGAWPWLCWCHPPLLLGFEGSPVPCGVPALLPGGVTWPWLLSPQRIEGRVAALQNAVDEYYKAKNEFAAKVSGAREVL